MQLTVKANYPIKRNLKSIRNFESEAKRNELKMRIISKWKSKSDKNNQTTHSHTHTTLYLHKNLLLHF